MGNRKADAVAKHRNDMNELRCVAAEIICKLYDAKDVSQLRLLQMQCDRSLEELARKGATA